MPKLFVVMPYGTRPAEHAADGSIDFDRVYREMIRPAGEVAGWSVLRIDELAEPGQISDQYLREILLADLVLADISIPNANVFYELGIRHAVSTGGAILIALQGSEIPFDLASHRVIFYGLTDREAIAAREKIQHYLAQSTEAAPTNPIRFFLERIGASTNPVRDAAAFERDLNARIERARSVDQLIAVWQWAKNLAPLPITPLLTLAERLSDCQEWATASEVLRLAAQQQPDDFEIHRKLGWYLQQLGSGHDAESLRELERALELNPQDPETLGMMGGRLKRAGNYAEAARFYGEAVLFSPNNTYNLVNLAALSILAKPHDPQYGIDRYEDLIRRLDEKRSLNPDEWTELVLGEAFFAAGRAADAERHFLAAVRLASSPKSLQSAAKQLELFAGVGFRTGEAQRFVKLLTQESIQVSAAATDPTASEPVLPILVHISDLHFGSLMRDGKKQDLHRFYDGENSQRMSRHIIEELSSPRSRLKGAMSRVHLVVSGDLTSTGSAEEFKEALECLDEICKCLDIGKERVHIIPGNHDVNWKFAAADPDFRFYTYIHFLAMFYGQELFKQKFPLLKWPIEISDLPKPKDIVSIYYDDSHRLLIAGLNSCIFETEQHHYGFVGDSQLKVLREHLDQMSLPRDVLKVATIHHHLHPFPELLNTRNDQEIWLDLSTIRDAGRVEGFLEKLGFDLVLHGHKHKPQLRETLMHDREPLKQEPRPLIVCGAGSVGCSSLQLEHSESNHYEILEPVQIPRRNGTKFLRVEWRNLPYTPGAEWLTTKTWEITG